MKDHLGRPKITEQDAIDILYTGKILPKESIVDLDKKFDENYTDIYNETSNFRFVEIDEEYHSYHNRMADILNYTRKYARFDIREYCLEFCVTDVQRERVEMEYELFISNGLEDLLKFVKFLVDHMREENLVWGVGRGSSVSSYILYLLGLHKVDSIKYDLDVGEFFKDRINEEDNQN